MDENKGFGDVSWLVLLMLLLLFSGGIKVEDDKLKKIVEVLKDED